MEKKKLEEKNAEAKAILMKELEAKIAQQKKEKEEREKEKEGHSSPKNSNQMAGVVLMSKKKNRDWLNVPTRQKPKYPMFHQQVKEEEVIEIEEDVEDIPDDPVLIEGGRANLLDVKVAELIRMDPERDCRKYNVKARAKEIFKALDVDKDGLVDEDEFIEGESDIWSSDSL